MRNMKRYGTYKGGRNIGYNSNNNTNIENYELEEKVHNEMPRINRNHPPLRRGIPFIEEKQERHEEKVIEQIGENNSLNDEKEDFFEQKEGEEQSGGKTHKRKTVHKKKYNKKSMKRKSMKRKSMKRKSMKRK